MAADVFGDSSLFSEFEKDRETERFLDNCEVEDIVGKSNEENNDGAMEENGNESSDSETDDDESKEIGDEKPKVELEECPFPSLSAENVTQHKLVYERNKYLSFAKMIDSSRFVPDEEGPALQVLYHNSNFSRKHRSEIESFIQHLMERDRQEEYKNGPVFLPKLNLKSTTPTCVDINNKLPSTKRTAEMWEAHAIIGNAHFHNSFMVDSRGWPITPNCQYQQFIVDMVQFEKIFETPLPLDEEDLMKIKKDQRQKASCFNCEGEHNLNECPQPKDFNRIGANRKKFQNSKANSVPKLSLSKNYSDFEEDPRFKKFRPGKISDELYSAMGISPNQLPLYIYKMRVLGYPPGWLIHAKKGYTSGIVIFDKEGRETNLKGESLEDGEINADKCNEESEEVQVDKIIEYPGFTVPTPEHVIDESDRLNLPPLQPHQLKMTLERQVSIQEEVKKRKAEEEEEIERKRIRAINKEADMELSDDEETSGTESDFRPPLPVDTPPSRPPIPTGTPPITPIEARSKNLYHPTLANLTPPHFGAGGPPLPDYTPPAQPPLPDGTPPPTPPISQRMISTDSTRSESPSFESLQNKYQDILKQLNEDSSSQSDSDVKIIENPSDDSDASVIYVSEFEKQTSNVSEVSMSEVSVRTLSRASSTLSVQSLDDSSPSLSRGISKVKEYGTPILEASTNATVLPSSEKFKVGTEEHLLFENLPGATGTFSRMRQLLEKIKSKTKKK